MKAKKMTKHKKIPKREIVDAPTLPGVDIIDLSHRTCRWPLWTDAEPARRYCGDPVVDGWSYCHPHRLLALKYPNK